MKILIAGSNGMIGSAVTRRLIDCGHEIYRLVRCAAGPNEVYWDPDNGEIDAAGLEGFDGVVHLATAPWPMRWSDEAKKAMLENRLATNGLLAKSLAGCERKPKVLICASGMGYYPTSGDEIITEDSPAGTSFLSQFQQAGEAATAPACDAGIRVVNLRIPTVLGGQALKQVGFRGGDGQQWVSWIGRTELASVIEFILNEETVSGPVNAVSPNPLRQSEFAGKSIETLGIKPGEIMPAAIVRTMIGEMGEEFILASRRMQPTKLLAAGYQFRFPDLAQALIHETSVVKEPGNSHNA